MSISNMSLGMLGPSFIWAKPKYTFYGTFPTTALPLDFVKVIAWNEHQCTLRYYDARPETMIAFQELQNYRDTIYSRADLNEDLCVPANNMSSIMSMGEGCLMRFQSDGTLTDQFRLRRVRLKEIRFCDLDFSSSEPLQLDVDFVFETRDEYKDVAALGINLNEEEIEKYLGTEFPPWN